MKKIIILTSLLFFLGIGCTKNTPPITTNQTNKLPDTNVVKEPTIEEKIGFKIHYPSYIPNGLEFNRENLVTFSGIDNRKGATYLLGKSTDTAEPWVIILEQKDTGEYTEIQKTAEKIEGLLNGFYITNEVDSKTYYHVIFWTENSNTIKLSSNYYDVEELTKIAKSMN
ncbi:MAG: hypothetical protein A2725_01800 [Candidatus Magasanikbacteria bacterium RIFCSPHIGHO2_01_FULL_33_34]|uniref:DUF4367 domain-containing protein n=1 Tax=Candidatus Magasanikbacteria bacterium RIFCSPHIGHO2_01_FULL_33_34 TaxID=1798671 RepID=A0A1F6LKL4_9BACT|nr:MAG: hypothetical protein A2725_01800 [Candidatus Magasanikbacteria bacterium RIFCSPHIGHO2_01_FULL_33_34]OGH65706.1 MAG: hypothetical protein A3B83_02305 [Candidatus Magasanikbacteria bacterium RIFCSPHIGHO2_02_FULL_33_17]OGH76319.1 MAG: hypothetical protein A3A89_03130 [Candidatus Magasanikbacteria bacterium RIFCSPLOWO2_01_FULL_33_34]